MDSEGCSCQETSLLLQEASQTAKNIMYGEGYMCSIVVLLRADAFTQLLRNIKFCKSHILATFGAAIVIICYNSSLRGIFRVEEVQVEVGSSWMENIRKCMGTAILNCRGQKCTR